MRKVFVLLSILIATPALAEPTADFRSLLNEINTVSVQQADRNDNWWELPYINYEDAPLADALESLGQTDVFRDNCDVSAALGGREQLVEAWVDADWQLTLDRQVPLFSPEEQTLLLAEDRATLLSEARVATRGAWIPSSKGGWLLKSKQLALHRARLDAFNEVLASCQGN